MFVLGAGLARITARPLSPRLFGSEGDTVQGARPCPFGFRPSGTVALTRLDLGSSAKKSFLGILLVGVMGNL